MKAVSLVERDGDVRSFHVSDVTAPTIRDVLRRNVAKEARLMTDEASMYTLVGREFDSHGVVRHGAKEYARDDTHTNTVEDYFAILRRGLSARSITSANSV